MELQKLKVFSDTVQRLSLARSMDAIAGVIRDTARSLIGADGVTFVLKDGDMCYYVEEDAIGPLWKGQRFHMSACVSGWSMIHHEIAVIEDIYADDRVPLDAYKPTFVKSMVMVPIRTLDPIGAIGSYWAAERTPTDEELDLLRSLADITSVSIENVYAFKELKEQNKTLYEIAYLQSHQVRVPVTQLQGLYQLLQLEDLQHPDNADVLRRMMEVVNTLDEVITTITDMTSKIKFY